MVKVSVIIPVLSSDKDIDKALNSIRHQTLPEIESIIIMPNQSDTANLQSEKNIRCFTIDAVNIATARDRGLQEANGEYVIFIDADDILISTALDKLYQNAIAHNLDVLAFSGVDVIVRTSPEGKESTAYYQSYLRSGEYPSVLTGKDMLTALGAQNSYYPVVSLQLYRTDYLRNEQNMTVEDEGIFTCCSLAFANRTGCMSDIYLYHCEKPNSQMIILESLQKENADLKKSVKDLEKKVQDASAKQKKIEESTSYKVGKKLTYLPGKVKKTFRNEREKR